MVLCFLRRGQGHSSDAGETLGISCHGQSQKLWIGKGSEGEMGVGKVEWPVLFIFLNLKACCCFLSFF